MKLLPIAMLVSTMLKEKFGVEAAFDIESRHSWLYTVPTKDIYGEYWTVLSEVYSHLIDRKWSLDEVIRQNKKQLNSKKQRVDIYFKEPYKFIFEFDEKQHFSQFRYITLKKNPDYNILLSNHDHYLTWNKNINIKPGKSGFQRLRALDPLFPPLLEGEKQDNRIRQRAFRDFLKDIVPQCMPKMNPTVRVSYHVTNGNINNFSHDDLSKIRVYLDSILILDKIKIDI
jgi:hypothetical protein